MECVGSEGLQGADDWSGPESHVHIEAIVFKASIVRVIEAS